MTGCTEEEMERTLRENWRRSIFGLLVDIKDLLDDIDSEIRYKS